MMLLTQDIRTKLETNGCEQQELISKGFAVADHMPVVKLFTPDASAVWLLTTLDPNDKDLAYGLCDLGFGSPELGHVRISEIEDVRGALNLPVERDTGFVPRKSIEGYAQQARKEGFINAATEPDEMALISEANLKQLKANGLQNSQLVKSKGSEARDFEPVVKISSLDGKTYWLLSEIDPSNPKYVFGFSNEGMGCPQAGFFHLSEIERFRDCNGAPAEQDNSFKATKNLVEYLMEALTQG